MNANTIYCHAINKHFKTKMLYFTNSVSYSDSESSLNLDNAVCCIKPPRTGKNPFDIRNVEYFAKEVAEQHAKIVHSSVATELANATNEVLASGDSKIKAILNAANAFFTEKEIPEEYQRIMVGPTLLNHLSKYDPAIVNVGFGIVGEKVWYVNESIGHDNNRMIAYAYSQAAIGIKHSTVGDECNVTDYEYDKEYSIVSSFGIASSILDSNEILKIKA